MKLIHIYFCICFVIVIQMEVLCRSDNGIRPRKRNGVENWGEQGVTKRENKLLNRKKRYLTFPMGAAFIMTLSLIKSLMIRAPEGLRLAAECDVPFSLPSDTRWFKRRKGVHQRQRREVFDQISVAFEGLGFNGTACVNRAICDVRAYAPLRGTSLVKDLLMALFKFDESQEYLTHCNAETYFYCDLPLLNYVEGLMKLDEYT